MTSPPPNQFSPGPDYSPVQTPVRHSLTWHEKLSEQAALTELQKKKPTKPATEQSWCFPGAGPGHTASPHRPRSICLITQVGTVPRRSLLNRPQCKVFLNHPLQGVSSHLCCLSHINCSERGRVTGCRKLHGNRFPLLRTSAFKTFKLDGATQITQDFPFFPQEKAKSLYSCTSQQKTTSPPHNYY